MAAAHLGVAMGGQSPDMQRQCSLQIPRAAEWVGERVGGWDQGVKPCRCVPPRHAWTPMWECWAVVKDVQLFVS